MAHCTRGELTCWCLVSLTGQQDKTTSMTTDKDDLSSDDDSVRSSEESASQGSSSSSSLHSDDDDENDDENVHVSRHNSWFTKWITGLAIFGDSVWSLTFTFAILVISILCSQPSHEGFRISFWKTFFHNNNDSNNTEQVYQKLGPVPQIDPPHIFRVDTSKWDNNDNDQMMLLDDQIRTAYQKDGVVAIRGLIHKKLLERLDVETAEIVNEQVQQDNGKRKRGNQFHTVNHGTIFRNTPTSAFVELALRSPVPRVAAELLTTVEQDPIKGGFQTIRLLRDIFLAKDDDPYTCGFHVDDLGFWPATPESVGVNAWVALDDMEDWEQGGGFALAVGSHVAPWRHEAHYVTGASTTFPPGGYANASDLVQRRTGHGTCNLKTSAPHLHRRMEDTKRIYPVRRGDVIFHTRWLFHRTVPYNKTFTETNKREKDDRKAPIFRRYSLRYGPGTAVIPPGYGTELSVLWDETNGGRTADQVCHRPDGDIDPWYPQVWPSVSEEEVRALSKLVQEKIPTASELRSARQKEMKPLLRRLAKEQFRPAL